MTSSDSLSSLRTIAREASWVALDAYDDRTDTVVPIPEALRFALADAVAVATLQAVLDSGLHGAEDLTHRRVRKLLAQFSPSQEGTK